MDYQNDIRINESALDVEWINQASLAMKYGEHWAECVREATRCEERIKLVRAELIEEANKDPETVLGKGIKPTGVNIESYYRNHSRHKKAKRDYVDACYERDIAEIAKKEICYTRKAALENLVRLHGQQYFASPAQPRDISIEVGIEEERQKEANNKVAKKLNRNKEN